MKVALTLRKNSFTLTKATGRYAGTIIYHYVREVNGPIDNVPSFQIKDAEVFIPGRDSQLPSQACSMLHAPPVIVGTMDHDNQTYVDRSTWPRHFTQMYRRTSSHPTFIELSLARYGTATGETPWSVIPRDYGIEETEDGAWKYITHLDMAKISLISGERGYKLMGKGITWNAEPCRS